MSKIAVNEITNEAGTGGPTLPNGIAGGLTLGGDLTLDTNGIYLGGTGSANYLDDYEEGTWTPVASTPGSGDIANVSGAYVKIGNMVFARFVFQVNNNSDSNQLRISGIPFSPESTQGWSGSIAQESTDVGKSFYVDLASSSYFIFREPGGSVIDFSQASTKIIRGSLSYSV